MLDVRCPHCFYDKIHRLTLHRIRDDPSRPTLTSTGFSDSADMTVENCVNECVSTQKSIAGLEQGTDCRK